MKIPNKGRIIRWTLLAAVVYVVFGFADVVPFHEGIKRVTVDAGKVLLVALAALVALGVVGAIGVRGSIYRRLEQARRVGDRNRFLDVLRAAPQEQALTLAAMHGEADTVRELLARGIHPDGYPMRADHSGTESPLVAAANAGSEEIVRMLIAAGADVNRKVGSCADEEVSALDWAVSGGYVGIVKMLLEHGADPTPQDWTISGAASDIVKLLLQHGADPNFAVPEAIADDDLERLGLLLQHGADASRALNQAIVAGRADMVKLLLQHGADLGALKNVDWRDPEQGAWLLADIGEHRQAADIAKAATGVELLVPDEALWQRAGKLRSLFLALAERYQAEGDFASARRLCEWKCNRGASLLDTSICRRVHAQIEEQQGNVDEALRLYREALGTWQLDERPEVWKLVGDNEGMAAELKELLRGSERVFARFGASDERDSAVAVLNRLEGGGS